MKAKFCDFFDVYNPQHLKAYHILQTTGMWPKGFIPSDIEMGPNWQFTLMTKFTDEWMKCAMNERWPTEIQIDLRSDFDRYM